MKARGCFCGLFSASVNRVLLCISMGDFFALWVGYSMEYVWSMYRGGMAMGTSIYGASMKHPAGKHDFKQALDSLWYG